MNAVVEGFGLVGFDLRQEKGGRWFELVRERLCLRLVRRLTRIELSEHRRVLL